ncbi:MAG: extracellular solute-binding protein [Lachnospiraceae bacterium]|nr:extracellular solute-binding protein [Lachnospiraceae bacterium]
MKKCFLTALIIFSLAFGACTVPSEDARMTTLTLATFERNRELDNWVSYFNSTHHDIQVEIVNYATESLDPYDAINRLKAEIVSGKGPDLVDFGYYYSPLDASSGILADLYPFMESDPAFDKEDYFYNIIKSFAVGEGLYVMVPYFSIKTFTTVYPGLSGRDSIDVRSLMEIYENRPEGTFLYPGEMKHEVLDRIAHGSMANYVDWESGTCRFDSEGFKALLAFANQFPDTLVWAEDYSVQSVFMEGNAILYPGNIMSVFDITGTKLFLGEAPTFIGHPMDSGNGNMAQKGFVAVSIGAASKNKEEAWIFVRSFLDADFQDSIDELPVSRAALERQLAEAMKPEYDENGEKIAKANAGFAGDAPLYIYEISAEDAELLRVLIEKVEFNSATDNHLREIIYEEADYYFKDGRGIDETAKIIQNRARIYISESK